MSAPAFSYSANPTGISAAGSEGLFTALQLYADKPQVKRKLYEKHGYRKSLYLILDQLGLGTPLKGPEFAHWEKDWFKQTFVVGSVITPTGGTGNPIVIALKAESMLTKTIDGVSVPFSFPQEQDIIEMPGTRAKAIIASKDTSVSPHRLTIKPMSNFDMAAYVIADARFFISSNAWAEGTGGAKSRLSIDSRWSNYTQIFKSKYSETGSSLTNELPYEPIPDKIGSYLLRGTDEAEKFMYDQISGAMISGIKSAYVAQNSSELDYDPIVKTTQGMIDYGVTEGTELSHTIGGIDISHFDSIGEIIRRERVNTNIIAGWMGYGHRKELENLMVDYFLRDLSVYANKFKPEVMAGSDPKDFFAWLGFSGLYKNGFNFVFNTLDELDDPQGMGVDAYNYSHLAMWMPSATLKNKGEKRDIPSVGFRYKELNGYSRKYELWNTGGAGPIKKTSDIDIMNCEFRSDIGFEAALGSQWVVDFGTD